MSSQAFNTQRIHLIKNPNYVCHGIKSYAHALRKYNFFTTMPGPLRVIEHTVESVHPHHQRLLKLVHPNHHAPAHTQRCLVKKDSETGQIGTVNAEDVQNDTQYCAPVTIGNQTVHLDFDSGSADLWCFSTHLSSYIQTQHQQAGGHVFDPAKSSTWVPTKQTFRIEYGDCSSANGTCGFDNVTIGGIQVKHQVVEIATEMSQSFAQGSGCDGLCGLSFDILNTVQPTPAQTIVDNLFAQHKVPTALFTCWLGSYKDTSDPDGNDCFYTLGRIDHDTVRRCSGGIQYATVDSTNGFWSVKSTSCVVNGKSIALPSNNTAIMDTGTTLCLVDDNTCKAIYGAIVGAHYDSAQQGWVVPSTVTTEQLPVVQLDIGGNLVTLQKEHLLFADCGNGTSYGGIQSGGTMANSSHMFIYGDVVLTSMYAIFDATQKRFGFCQRMEETQNLNPTPAAGSTTAASRMIETHSGGDSHAAKTEAMVAKAVEAFHDAVAPPQIQEQPHLTPATSISKDVALHENGAPAYIPLDPSATTASSTTPGPASAPALATASTTVDVLKTAGSPELASAPAAIPTPKPTKDGDESLPAVPTPDPVSAPAPASAPTVRNVPKTAEILNPATAIATIAEPKSAESGHKSLPAAPAPGPVTAVPSIGMPQICQTCGNPLNGPSAV